MKRVTKLSLVGLSTAVVLSGGVFSTASAAPPTCNAAMPVYTDNLAHFVGICAGGAYFQVNETSAALAGKTPLVEFKTGQAAIDGLLAGGGAAPVQPASDRCTATPDDAVVVYTDAFAHVVGVCSSNVLDAHVGNTAGALAGQNPLISVHNEAFDLDVYPQASDGTNAIVIHPKVVFKPFPNG